MQPIAGISCGLMLGLLGWSLAGTSRAEELAADPVEVEYRQLERDIPALYLINGLFLSADQAKSLAALQAEAKVVTDKIRIELDQFMLNHKNDLDQWLEASLRAGAEAGKGSGSAARDWPQLQKVRREFMALHNAQGTNLYGLAGKTLALLTPAQAEIVGSFVPCFIPPQDFRNPERVGQAEGDTSLGEKILARLREAPPDKQDQVRDKALDLLLPYYQMSHRQTLTAEEMQALRTRLGRKIERMMPRIQKMSAADFQLGKAALVKELLELAKTKAPPADAREVLGKVIRYLLDPGVQGILARRSGADSAGDLSSVVARELQNAALQARGRPFRAVGLANELGLTPVQAGQLLPIVRALATQRKAIDERARQFMQQALPAFLALVKELADQQPTSKTEAAANRRHHQVTQLFEEEYLKELLVAEGQVDLLLSADQVQALMAEQSGKYRKSSWQPRGGQAIKDNRRRAVELLDAMDKSTPAEWRKAKPELCRSFVESCIRDRDADSLAVDVAAQAARAEQVLDRARAMGQKDYLQAREELAAELCPRRNQPRPAVYGWKQAHGDPLESLNLTTYLLFSPAMQTVLDRVASRKTGI